ncbi:MAG: D-alanyl-D-alanine carboxypeptidase/D-alanyl-D-alanine-endopeptidase [Flavobacteriales bacterium]
MKLQSYLFLFNIFLSFFTISQNLDSAMSVFTKDPYLKKANISLLAIDITTGDTLMFKNPDLAVATASTTKVFSTAMAYEVLGPAHRPQTEFYTDGIIQRGVLLGNLWVKGGGDLSLGSNFFYSDSLKYQRIQQWKEELLTMGIREIDGVVYFDGSAFGYDPVPKGWSHHDFGNYYAAFPGGLNFSDNLCEYVFSSKAVGKKAMYLKSVPNQPNMVVNASVYAANIEEEMVTLKGSPYHMTRSFSGSIPANKDSVSVVGSLPDPEKSFAGVVCDVFDDTLVLCSGTSTMREGKNKKPDYDQLTLLFRDHGLPINEIATVANHKSNNFFAEGLFQSVAYHVTGDGSNQMAVKVAKTFWGSRIDTTHWMQYDGSGLSRKNRISAGHLCSVLRYMSKTEDFNSFYSSLPVAGVSGTLTNLCKDGIGSGRIHAKSGTMNGIKSYAGYIESASGHTIAFAIVANGFTCSRPYVVSKMEVVLNALAGY